ncbi:MAG: peptidoglycan DD-metalloendopeptidase family protein [Flavobacteriaceae bacterium]
MKKVVFLLFLLATSLVFSQEEKENYKKVSASFMNNFNNEAYKSIFEMFGSEMKIALPLDKTESLFKNNIAPAGKITSMEFSKLRGTAHIYKTTFDTGTILDFTISLDAEDNINGFFAALHQPESKGPKLDRNTTKIQLPFNEEWTVVWGGTSVEQNYHVAYNNQKYAYDLLMMEEGKSFKNDGKSNDDYFVFGKQVIAPCDATIVEVITGVKDNIPGELNPKQLTGNTVVLKTANAEFLLFAHFKEKSIQVKVGQQVKAGDLLGLCGNSGNSSEPHLHLSLQNVKNMMEAQGGKLFFENIKVNGKIKEDYLPVKNDKIQNIKR